MARIKLSNELKEAIAGLTHKEKDKLLFRLIAKDQALVNKLIFDLLEAGETKDIRRQELYEMIEQKFAHYRYYSPGYLLLLLRNLSGDINRHLKTTKDKYGEIQLNFLMLNKSFELFGDQIRQASPRQQHTFAVYVVKRALKLLKLLGKMHEDYLLDFQDDMKKLGHYIGDQPYVMKIAIYNMLDVNWLVQGRLPDY